MKNKICSKVLFIFDSGHVQTVGFPNECIHHSYSGMQCLEHHSNVGRKSKIVS